MNTFEFSVRTRDGRMAHYNQLADVNVVRCDETLGPVFVLMGVVGNVDVPDMWTSLGRFAYDGKPHALDLMFD